MADLVSVVILSHNRIDNIKELLPTLSQQTYPSLEIILIDNGSTDGTFEYIQNEWPDVVCIQNDRNYGMVAYNQGFAIAKGMYLVVIDDDGLPSDDLWIQQIVDHFLINHRLGAVCCTIRMRDTGLIAHDSPQFIPSEPFNGGYPAIAFNGTGAGLRVQALQEVGYYPADYFLTFLELHLCTRLIDSGWEVRHFPHLEVWHSRLSGSTYPARDYSGLRNYYWYAMEFYPWSNLIYELIHEVGYRFKLVAKGQLPVGLMVTTLFDAFWKAPRIFKRRTPVSAETIRYLRDVRKHGNWHGIVAKHQIFNKTHLQSA